MNGMNEHFYERDLENEKDELKKEVAALRRALKSHGEIVEENYKLREKLKTSIGTSEKLQSENARLRLELYKFKEAKSHHMNGALYYKEE